MEVGFDGLHCIEPSAGMDIKEIKQEYGERLCLMGNIDPALLVDHNRVGAPDKDNHNLTLAVESLMASAAPGGGFIFGSCSGLHRGMSPRKVHFMFELAE